jgi:hypothetical protein
MYSSPPSSWDWHAALRVVPLMGFSDRLSMVSATHHLVGSQLEPANWEI